MTARAHRSSTFEDRRWLCRARRTARSSEQPNLGSRRDSHGSTTGTRPSGPAIDGLDASRCSRRVLLWPNVAHRRRPRLGRLPRSDDEVEVVGADGCVVRPCHDTSTRFAPSRAMSTRSKADNTRGIRPRLWPPARARGEENSAVRSPPRARSRRRARARADTRPSRRLADELVRLRDVQAVPHVGLPLPSFTTSRLRGPRGDQRSSTVGRTGRPRRSAPNGASRSLVSFSSDEPVQLGASSRLSSIDRHRDLRVAFKGLTPVRRAREGPETPGSPSRRARASGAPRITSSVGRPSPARCVRSSIRSSCRPR